tara:strand:+ start:3859 stop:5199 length:1341 start_codon:yes stop_codon:yes gene_type:complete
MAEYRSLEHQIRLMNEAKKLDPVDPEELKGKHDDREDGDIDNDGDKDKSDKFLHKKRKAISKAVKGDKDKEEIDMDPKIDEINAKNARKADKTGGEDPMQKIKEDEEVEESIKKLDAKDKDLIKKAMGPKKDANVRPLIKLAKMKKESWRVSKKTNASHYDMFLEALDAEVEVELFEKTKEEIVKAMKKNSDFEKRYGDRADQVRHATATKLATEEIAWDIIKENQKAGYSGKKGPLPNPSPSMNKEAELPRQLKDKKKEMMVKHKKSGVKVIDKKQWPQHKAMGYFPAEETEVDESTKDSHDHIYPKKQAIKWKVKPPAGTKNVHPDSPYLKKEETEVDEDYKESVQEGTWHLPKGNDLMKLRKLMKKPIPVGNQDKVEQKKAVDDVPIGDDELYDDYYTLYKKKGKNADARDVIKKAMKRLGIREEVVAGDLYAAFISDELKNK